jgi:hypothetical protein
MCVINEKYKKNQTSYSRQQGCFILVYSDLKSPENKISELKKDKILKTDINLIKNDVLPFIKNPLEMDIWSVDYFLQLVEIGLISKILDD